MAGEFKHITADRAVASVLEQAEFDKITAHGFPNQATGDLPYASSATQLSRLGIGSAGQILTVVGGIPGWAAAGSGEVSLTLAQTFITGIKTFNSSILAIRNPADTFKYVIIGGAILADRNITLPLLTGDDVLVTAAFIQTLTNKRITKRIGTVADSATPTPAGDDVDMFTVTALAQAATFGAPTGTPTNGQTLIIRILDNGTARVLAWNAIYVARGVALPLITVLGKYKYLGFVYSSQSSKWDLIAASDEA